MALHRVKSSGETKFIEPTEALLHVLLGHPTPRRSSWLSLLHTFRRSSLSPQEF
jgi:hypothetical protein